MPKFAVVIFALTMSISANAIGDSPKLIDVPAGDLSAALELLERQSGVEIVYRPELLKGVHTDGVKGTLSSEEAVTKLLKGTKLKLHSDSSGVLLITDARAEGSAGVTSVEKVSAQSLGDASPRESLRVAQVEQRATGPQLETSGDQNSEMKRKDQSLTEIVVTGTHIRGQSAAGADVSTVTREQIRESGRGTLAEVLQTQTDISAAGPGEASSAVGRGSGNLGYASGLNLRGLGVDETLTLLDGHRLAPSGLSGQFADVSQIPLVAVDRVEILADGASATYGSDAMAGVVNVILRKDFTGAESRLRFGSVTEGSTREYQASQLFGKAWDSGHITAAFEYYDRGNLPAADRDYASNSDLRAFGGSNNDSNFSNPGNITGPAGLIGAIPAGQNGSTLTASQILLGRTNLQNTHLGVDILPDQRRMSLFLDGSQNLGESSEGYFTFLGSQRYTYIQGTAANATLVVPTTNAYRLANGLNGATSPLNQPIRVNYSFNDDLGPSQQGDTSQSLTSTLGLLTHLGSSWALDSYAAFGRSGSESATPVLDSRSAAQGGALNIALASPTLATAFNPFGDGSYTNESVLAGLRAPVVTDVHTKYWSLNAKLDGSLFRLPAGDVKLAAGAEYRREDFDYFSQIKYDSGVIPAATTLSGSRNVTAVFGELYVPFVAPENHIPAFRQVDLTVSARMDHYSDFGSTTNPKIGFRWLPIQSLTLRGTYGTSFRAPLLSDLYSPRIGQTFSLPVSFGGPDPNHDGFTNILETTGGDARLEPEKGKTWTAGLDFKPVALPGFTARVTYFNIRLTDRFATLASPVTPLGNPAPYLGIIYFPNPSQALVDSYVASTSMFVTPPPAAGTVEAIVDAAVRNLSIVDMDGLDLGAGYRWDTAVGQIGLNANATDTMSFRQKFSSTSPTQELLNTVGNLVRLKLRGGVSWSRGPFGASLLANYVGHYTDTESAPYSNVASWTTFDLYTHFAPGLENGAPLWANGLDVSLSVVNLFNRDPPFVNSPQGGGYGFDGANATALGRFISLELTKKW